MTALYEIRGVNVVDTPPSKIAEEFKRYTGGETKEINWVELIGKAQSFDPEEEYNKLVRNGIGDSGKQLHTHEPITPRKNKRGASIDGQSE